MQNDMTPHRFYATPALARTIEVQGRQRKWIAERVGVHKSLITKLIGRERSVSQEVANGIAIALGSDVFVLFESLDRDELVQTGSHQ